MLIIRDLTEQIKHEQDKEEMRRQLFQTSKLASIGELSAGVAHEINNPVGAMMLAAQNALDASAEAQSPEE